MTIVAFWADVEVDGERHRLWREIGTQRRFDEPWRIAGMHPWLDDVLGILHEAHGLERVPDGRTWALGCHPVVRRTAPAHQPIAAGTRVARGAGVAVGSHEPSHCTFAIRDGDDPIRLDPWILFGQTYQDVHGRTGPRVGHLESGSFG